MHFHAVLFGNQTKSDRDGTTEKSGDSFMKELIEKVGISELFAYLCPGLILLLSLRFWIEPKKMDEIFREIIKQDLILVILVLILSYTLGLIVASWSNRGAALYYRLKGRIKVSRQISNDCYLFQNIALWLIGFMHWLPQFRVNASVVANNLRIAQDLDELVRLQGLSSLDIPWDRLVIYRTIMAGRVGEKGKTILTEADSIHRRFLFALGVAMALFLLAFQSLIRLILSMTPWNASLPHIPVIWLVVIAFLAGLTSYSLRIVAGRWWEQELILTSSLTQLSKS
jgi:hypothetical protein